MKLPPNLTIEKIEKAVKSNMFGNVPTYYGFCLACGKKVNGVEPDARNYTCQKCGKPEVFGAEEILLSIY